MSTIRRICVYCGSGPGTDPDFVAAARAFGRLLAENGIGLVYGGGSVGLMGELARRSSITAAKLSASSRSSSPRARASSIAAN